MGLMCQDRTKINHIISAYFMAFGISGLFLFKLPDKYGCRKTMVIFGGLHMLAQFTMLLVPIYEVRLLAMAMMGVC
jgi:MFS family permease